MKNIFKAILMLLPLTFGCREFLEVDIPKDQIDQIKAFNNDNIAVSALVEVYSNLRDNGILNGESGGTGFLLGCYTDELEVTYPSTIPYKNFYQGSILNTNSSVLDLWTKSYKQIYIVNNIIEGLDKSKGLTESLKQQLKGEALVIKGLIHFYLSQTFGDVPYIQTTDYHLNKKIGKTSRDEMLKFAIADLITAEKLLTTAYPSTERIRINKTVAQAFLARFYLYQRNWNEAKKYAELVISNPIYELEPLNKVFLKDSKSAIWQFMPAAVGRNADEARLYFYELAPAPSIRLSNYLIDGFEIGDLRKNEWIGRVGAGYENSFAYKYKAIGLPTREYSVIIRIQEMYLIMAEVAAELEDWDQCNRMLNMIRSKAGLNDINVSNRSEAMDAIVQERKVEFFCEYGHRFYDLKRMGRLNDLLTAKPYWKPYFNLLPIPDAEIQLNGNLKPQNPGY